MLMLKHKLSMVWRDLSNTMFTNNMLDNDDDNDDDDGDFYLNER